jgi:heme A synthase
VNFAVSYTIAWASAFLFLGCLVYKCWEYKPASPQDGRPNAKRLLLAALFVPLQLMLSVALVTFGGSWKHERMYGLLMILPFAFLVLGAIATACYAERYEEPPADESPEPPPIAREEETKPTT